MDTSPTYRWFMRQREYFLNLFNWLIKLNHFSIPPQCRGRTRKGNDKQHDGSFHGHRTDSRLRDKLHSHPICVLNFELHTKQKKRKKTNHSRTKWITNQIQIACSICLVDFISRFLFVSFHCRCIKWFNSAVYLDRIWNHLKIHMNDEIIVLKYLTNHHQNI